jgi:SAM-dependent MidA family methyltransferase
VAPRPPPAPTSPLSALFPDLPPPAADALAHSEQLRRVIADRIVAAGGWVPFDAYMDLALYAPGLGYYAGGSRKFGVDGDFVTAPEISDLFGRTLARQIAQVLAMTGGDVLELGPGTGRLAAVLLAELARLGQPPGRYLLLDVSADLRDRQRQRIAESVPGEAHRAAWIDALPDGFRGVILANEVLDALPVSLVSQVDAGLQERGVSLAGDAFAWAVRQLVAGPVRDRAEALALPSPYDTEFSPRAEALVRALAGCLTGGALIFVDYGFGRREYYHPQRDRGTLVCHYRHRMHDDPLVLPGLQDITAHVDFTAVAEAGVAAGLQFAGYTTQANFLVNCGIAELLSEVPAAHASAYLPLASQAQKLMSPSEMGELFKVLALSRGVDAPLLGFSRGDLARLL